MDEIRSQHAKEELILRYLNGEAAASEVGELEAWVQADPEHKALFMQMKKAWMLSGMVKGSEVNVDAEWNTLAGKLETRSSEQVKVVPLRSRRMLLRIAAVVVLVVLAGAILFRTLTPGAEGYLASSSPEIIQLSDGSVVTLNRESSLKWDADKDGMRSATLSGDAYFDVARDEAKPFLISANGVEVEVLGTAFYVDAREGQQAVAVTVESGRVVVRGGTEEVILNPGEKAVFDKASSALAKTQNTDPNYNSVKTQTLTFANSGLDAVAETLNRHYHARIAVENSVLETCALTATFENKSLDAVLQIIASTIEIEIVRQPQQIILRGSCTF